MLSNSFTDPSQDARTSLSAASIIFGVPHKPGRQLEYYENIDLLLSCESACDIKLFPRTFSFKYCQKD